MISEYSNHVLNRYSSNQYLIGRERPLRPGASVGVIGGIAGTITALVKRTDIRDGKSYLLSCEHVLKPKNINGKIQVVQPAVNDGSGTGMNNRIGTIIKTAGLSETGHNTIDAAIVRLFPDLSSQNLTLGKTKRIFSIDRTLRQGIGVTMFGRSSGVVNGVICDTTTDMKLDYRYLGWKQLLTFSAISKCDYPSSPGDSGAPIINSNTGKLIGMHIAGGEDKNGNPLAFFCPIWRVFEELNIELI